MKNDGITRVGLIDGLPNSYDTSYIVKTKKSCGICLQLISEIEIHNNDIVCLETFDFFHKNCLKKDGKHYIHQNPKDKSTPAKIEDLDDSELSIYSID